MPPFKLTIILVVLFALGVAVGCAAARTLAASGTLAGTAAKVSKVFESESDRRDRLRAEYEARTDLPPDAWRPSQFRILTDGNKFTYVAPNGNTQAVFYYPSYSEARIAADVRCGLHNELLVKPQWREATP